jgi:hypothetical protein
VLGPRENPVTQISPRHKTTAQETPILDHVNQELIDQLAHRHDPGSGIFPFCVPVVCRESDGGKGRRTRTSK